MSSGKWNYRVVREHYDGGVTGLAIYEAYYEPGDAPDSLPPTLTANAVSPYGDDLEELRSTLGLMLLALDLPIVDAVEWERARKRRIPAPGATQEP